MQIRTDRKEAWLYLCGIEAMCGRIRGYCNQIKEDSRLYDETSITAEEAREYNRQMKEVEEYIKKVFPLNRDYYIKEKNDE